MTHRHLAVQPGKKEGTVLTESGEQLIPPSDWAFLPAGDAAITRSVKAKGTTWVVQIRKGRRKISRGVWADKKHIHESQTEVETKRATPAYAKRRKADLARRKAVQEKYVLDFRAAVTGFLAFHPRYSREAEILGRKITEHAVPVGSGTVARTERIPIEKRAEAATIAWMRHHTTPYDSMKISRIKGSRREVRRQLAVQSLRILNMYRNGDDAASDCPLKKAI